jgi:hypothetical protein
MACPKCQGQIPLAIRSGRFNCAVCNTELQTHGIEAFVMALSVASLVIPFGYFMPNEFLAIFMVVGVFLALFFLFSNCNYTIVADKEN